MATIKQMKMLAARAKEAGMKYDFEDFKDLTNGMVDEELAKIEKFAQDGKAVGSKRPIEQPKELNGQRFGMVYKIVIDRVGHAWKDENKDRFMEEVVEEYWLATATENMIAISQGGD